MRYKKGKIQLDIGVPELTLAALLLAAKGKEVLLSALLAASLHEAGHLLMMRLLKKDAAGMTITPFGARIDYQKEQILSYRQDGWIAAAGPAASLLTALVFAFLWICYARCSPASSSAGFRKKEAVSGIRASAAIAQKAPERLKRSATMPSTGAMMPPMLIARPSVTPEAKPTWFGRYCWPRTTIGL